MKTGEWVVVLLAGVFLVVAIRRLRARDGRARSPLVSALGWLRKHGPWAREHKLLGDTGLVAGREIRERLRGRVFWVVTAILFAGVAAAIVIPTTLHSTSSGTSKVAVVGASPSLDDELLSVARSDKLSVRLVDEPDVATAKAALSAGQVKLVVDGTTSLVVNNPISASDITTGAQFVRDLAETLGAEKAFRSAGLTPAQASAVARAKALPVTSLRAAKKARTTAEATALIGVIVIFIVLMQYLTRTLMGVMEEKSSRVVEVLLATVRPVQLLAGKLLGIGVVAMVQAGAGRCPGGLCVVVGGRGGIEHPARRRPPGGGGLARVVGHRLRLLQLAVRRRRLVGRAPGPGPSVPMDFGYIVALIGVSSGSPSLLVKVLAYLPPTAPFAMPTLVGFGQVTWWQLGASVVISVLTTVGVALGAARVYRRAVLRTGRRVHLRDLVTSAAGS